MVSSTINFYYLILHDLLFTHPPPTSLPLTTVSTLYPPLSSSLPPLNLHHCCCLTSFSVIVANQHLNVMAIFPLYHTTYRVFKNSHPPHTILQETYLNLPRRQTKSIRFYRDGWLCHQQFVRSTSG